MRKIPIFLLMFFIMISCAFAAPPFQTGQLTSPQLSIDYPKYEDFPKPFNPTTNLTLHFHIYNSTGYAVTAASCYIHIYNCTDNHILEKNLTKDSNGIDYFININGSVLNHYGLYTYLLYCNNSNEAGWLSNSFTINSQGEKKKDGLYSLAIMLGLGLFAIILLLMYNFIDKEHWLFKIIMIMLVPLVLINMGSFALEVSIGSFVQSQGESFYKLTLWFIRLFYTYVIVALIFTAFTAMANVLKKHKKV